MINLDLPWNPAVLEQRIGRIYRLGQKQPIDVYNLVSEQGIESRIAVLVDSKQAFFKGLFDGDTDTVRFGEASGFLARIQKLIDPSAIAVVAARGGQAEAEPDRGETTDLDIDIDDEVDDPLDELIDAADEADDSPMPEPAAAADGDGRGEAGAAAPAAAPEPSRAAVPRPEPEANGTAHPTTHATDGTRARRFAGRRPATSSPSSRSVASRAARSSSRRRPRPPGSSGRCSRAWRRCSNRSDPAGRPVTAPRLRTTGAVGHAVGLVKTLARAPDRPAAERSTDDLPLAMAPDPRRGGMAGRDEPHLFQGDSSMDRRDFFKQTAAAGTGPFLLGGAAGLRPVAPTAGPNETGPLRLHRRRRQGRQRHPRRRPARRRRRPLRRRREHPQQDGRPADRDHQGKEVFRLPQDARGARRQDRRRDRQHARPQPRPGQRHGDADGQALLHARSR